MRWPKSWAHKIPAKPWFLLPHSPSLVLTGLSWCLYTFATFFLPPTVTLLIPLCLIVYDLFFWFSCGAILDLSGRLNPFPFLLLLALCIARICKAVYAIPTVCSLGPLHLPYLLPGTLFCLIPVWLTLSPFWVFSPMPSSQQGLQWSPRSIASCPTGTLPILWLCSIVCQRQTCYVTAMFVILYLPLEHKPIC